MQSPLNVIAIKSYVAKQEHELTLQKDAKFDVIGRISNAWLIGVLDGRRGTFPAECVKVRKSFVDVCKIVNNSECKVHYVSNCRVINLSALLNVPMCHT